MDPLLQSLREMGGGISLDLDHTFWFQLVLVISTIVLLKRFIFDPYLRTLDDRELKTGATRAKATALREKAEAAAQRYRDDLDAARDKALSVRASLRTEAVDAKEATVSAAKADAEETIREAQARLEAELESARKDLATKVDDLSTMVVDKVLGQRG